MAVPDFRDRRALRGTHADSIDHDSLSGRVLCCAYGIVLVVFSIADDDDGLVVGCSVFRVEVLDAEVDGRSDSCALAAQVGGLDIVDEQFGGPIVGSQGQLHVGIACEYD